MGLSLWDTVGVSHNSNSDEVNSRRSGNCHVQLAKVWGWGGGKGDYGYYPTGLSVCP